ncbi:MAG: 2-amino-4-hydroxy-6-hydroxymethyldihydropteridine diphosphokinase [Alloprevotella sp.]
MKLYVALGANLGNRRQNIEQAIEALARRIGSCGGCSALYETKPQGFHSDHLFLNAVAVFETSLPTAELLDITQTIESSLGRTTKSHDGMHTDRTIDIDLLIYGRQTVRTDNLTLPHPLMSRRRFVMEPMAELAPDLVHPLLGQSMKDLLNQLNQLDIARLDHYEETTLTAVNRLLPQLSAHASSLSETDLIRLIDCPTTQVFLGHDEEGTIQAMATLSLMLIPTGVKAWIEDVVVDENCRGRGYGRQLLTHLIAEARRLGASSVNLTSKPERVAANRLYRSLGFRLRQTNVYRLPL